jgi:hypothetical protein
VGSFPAADSCSTDRAAIVKRDIVHKPGVISSDAVEGGFSTGGGTGIGIVGDDMHKFCFVHGHRHIFI